MPEPKEAEALRLVDCGAARLQFQLLDANGFVVAYATLDEAVAFRFASSMLEMCGAAPVVIDSPSKFLH